MNILILSRCPPYPLHLGDRLILYHLAEQLSARGQTIDLLAFSADMGDLADVRHYEQCYRSVKLIPEPRRTSLDYLRRLLSGTRRFFPARAEQAWSPEMWTTAASHIEKGRYDVVLSLGGILVYEYRELLGRLPKVIVPYESYSLFIRRALDLQWRQGNWPRVIGQRLQLTIARRYERAMFAGYDRVIVLTDQDREVLHKLNPALPLAVIPNGIEADYFAPQAEPADGTEPSLIFFGNFEYQPNADAALWLAEDILPLIRVKYPAIRLLLVGNGPSKAMRALASERVEVTGRVPDIRPYVQRASIFICPLRFGAGIKNKVLEAMAMGKPLVATPLSCDGIGLEPGTNVLYGESAVELAAGVVRLLGDSGLRTRMAAANRQRILQGYTWSRVADQYEAMFAELTGHPS